jgi:hypothetical protein
VGLCGPSSSILHRSSSIHQSYPSVRRCFHPGDLNEASSVTTVIYEDPDTFDHRRLVYHAATYLLALAFRSMPTTSLSDHILNQDVSNYAVLMIFIDQGPGRGSYRPQIRQMNRSGDDVMVTNGRGPHRIVYVQIAEWNSVVKYS